MFFFFNFYLTFWLILSRAWFLSLSLAALYLEFLAIQRNILMRNIWIRVATWPPLMVGQASYSVPTTCSPSYVARLIQHKYTIQIFTTNTWHRCNRNVLDFYTNSYKSQQLHGMSKFKRLSSTSGRMFIKFNCTSSTVKLPHVIFLCKFVCSCIYWSFLMSVIFPSGQGWKHTSGLLTSSFAALRSCDPRRWPEQPSK